jgi:hypothetical protein
MGAHGLYLCPLEPQRDAPTVWADDIPGGLDIAHGLCNEDGSPRRYYSRSAIKTAAEVKGLMPYHEAFSEGENRILKDARVHDDWLKSGEAQRQSRDRDEQRRAGVYRPAGAQMPQRRAQPSEQTTQIAREMVARYR